MTGESTAGVIISLSRIFTKLLISNERINTLIFFLVSITMEMLCFLLHLIVRRSRFVLYYTGPTHRGHSLGKGHDIGSEVSGTGYRVHHDVTTEEGNGVVATTTSPSDDVTEEFTGGTYVRFGVPKDKIRRSWPGLRDMFLHRYIVARVIWAYMLSIAVTYSITLCLFPGLESEIRNPTLGEWLPILIMATFNMADFVGKVSLLVQCSQTSPWGPPSVPNLSLVTPSRSKPLLWDPQPFQTSPWGPPAVPNLSLGTPIRSKSLLGDPQPFQTSPLGPPAVPNLFSGTPSVPNLSLGTPSHSKPLLGDPQPFQTSPWGPPVFQTSPWGPPVFQTSPWGPPVFQTSPWGPPAVPNLFYGTPNHSKPLLWDPQPFQTSPHPTGWMVWMDEWMVGM
ncbi:uncharacterized protein LOC135566758 isoform X2 [Oncorhynchus nerka]|uniref:uncharacterized protein LOC135566758 isoform X2 n=1 Tax=Oncorhynchus nerka TaxID=8023 RepID=UPI0031B82F85